MLEKRLGVLKRQIMTVFVVTLPVSNMTVFITKMVGQLSICTERASAVISKAPVRNNNKNYTIVIKIWSHSYMYGSWPCS